MARLGLEIEPKDITGAKKAYRTRTDEDKLYEKDFPPVLDIRLTRESTLKYGENPSQRAACYTFDSIAGQQASKIAELTNILAVRSDGKGKGGLSATNLMDIARAMENLKFFREQLAAVIMKHNIVSGFAETVGFAMNEKSSDLRDGLFRTARECDRRSNFGGTLALTYPMNMETAVAVYELYGQTPRWFIDVIAAPGYEEGVVAFIQKQANDVRIAEFSHLYKLPRFRGDETYGLKSFKELPTGRVIVQDLYLPSIRTVDDLVLRPKIVDKQKGEHTIQYVPDERMLRDMFTAWYLNVAGARSNGVVAVRDNILISMGAGQVERVGAVEQMIIKGEQKAMDREGIEYDPLMGIQGYEQLKDNPFLHASVSSDAYIPFSDSIHRLARVGVGGIIQPYGSVNDSDAVDAANERHMAMVATLERCFGHF